MRYTYYGRAMIDIKVAEGKAGVNKPDPQLLRAQAFCLPYATTRRILLQHSRTLRISKIGRDEEVNIKTLVLQHTSLHANHQTDAAQTMRA